MEDSAVSAGSAFSPFTRAAQARGIPQPDAFAQASHRAYELLHIHELLLRDSARNRAFHDALKAAITPGCAVLDIGSGSGIWAITAAKLGAGKVTAIEREPLLIGLIQALARDNGVADRVEVVQGDSRTVQLAREFDIVVSETVGHVIFDEEIVPIMLDARARFLKPGGRLIPESVALMVAGARLDRPTLPASVPGNFSRFDSLTHHAPLAFTDKRPVTLLTPPAELIALDFARLAAEPDVSRLSARWPAQAAKQINCFIVWAEAVLTPGVKLSTMDTPSWSATVYRTHLFDAESGTLEFHLSLSHSTNEWTASLDHRRGRESQTHSPAIAATELLALASPDAEVFEKMKRHNLRLGLHGPAPQAHE